MGREQFGGSSEAINGHGDWWMALKQQDFLLNSVNLVREQGSTQKKKKEEEEWLLFNFSVVSCSLEFPLSIRTFM